MDDILTGQVDFYLRGKCQSCVLVFENQPVTLYIKNRKWCNLTVVVCRTQGTQSNDFFQVFISSAHFNMHQSEAQGQQHTFSKIFTGNLENKKDTAQLKCLTYLEQAVDRRKVMCQLAEFCCIQVAAQDPFGHREQTGSQVGLLRKLTLPL